MRINTNVSSLTAQEAAQNTSKRITSSLEKLSTGLRINKASDDASGLAIADKLRTQATSINQGIANGNSAVSLLQIADKSMAEQSNILDTINAKLIQANTDTTSADGRESIRKDIAKLLEQLDNIAEQTNYNGNVLLQQSATDKSASNKLNFQIGETNRDMIQNAAIQSNTDGLGSEVVYSAENQNDTMTAASTMTLASTGTISLTSTNTAGNNTAESVSFSGDLDSLTLKAGMTLSGMNSATQTAFDAAGFTVGVDYTQSGSSYTMLTDQSLDLSTVDNVALNVTTPAESSSNYSAELGDVVSNIDVNDGSALATALLDTSKFTDNLDGTYTAKVAGSYTLEAGESVDYSRATTQANVSTGQTVTLGANVVAGSELDKALGDAAKFTLTSGTAGQSGAVYTAVANVSNIGVDDAESIDITTPAVAAAATNLVTTVGDIVDITTGGGNVNTGSALETALADDTKFEDLGGGKYKALTDETIALESAESVQLLNATTVNVGQGGAFPAGSSLQLNSVPVTGSDLYNQLSNGSTKFTLVSGTLAGGDALYTVNEDFTTDNIKLVEGESITMSAAQELTLTGASDTAMIDDATLTFTPDGGAAVNLDYDATNSKVIPQGGADGDTPYQISTRGVMEFDVTAQTDGDTFAIKAGDVVTITNDDNTNGLATSEQITESANWIDNGDGSYTAIADQTITFDDDLDKLNVKRTVGTSLTTADFDGTAATTVSRIDTPASTSTVAGAANTTGTVAPSATISVDFTTGSKVDVTNNGLAANTLTISGTEEITNGGTQLSALAEIGAGELTQDLAASFQAVIDDAITDLNAYRGDIGSTQNQVESAVRNLMTQATNVKAAESIIRDVDYAAESANFNKQNIISQAGSYAISQSNAVQQNVLRLLQ